MAGVTGIGVDLCSIARIARVVDRYGDRFLSRGFHEREAAAYREILARSGGPAATAFLASRWAAKEALHKALSSTRLLFPEVEVCRYEPTAAATGGRGQPSFAFHGRAAERIANRGVRALLSLSHDAGAAIAMVVLV